MKEPIYRIYRRMTPEELKVAFPSYDPLSGMSPPEVVLGDHVSLVGENKTWDQLNERQRAEAIRRGIAPLKEKNDRI